MDIPLGVLIGGITGLFTGTAVVLGVGYIATTPPHQYQGRLQEVNNKGAQL